MKTLNEMTVKELKEMAKNLKISNWWNLKKEKLIARIEEAQVQPSDEEFKDEAISINKEENVSEVENEAPKMVPMPGTEDPNWGEKHWGQDIEKSEKKPRGKLIEYKGKAQTLNAWADELGFAPQTLFARLYMSNWPVEKAFETPSRRKTK